MDKQGDGFVAYPEIAGATSRMAEVRYDKAKPTGNQWHWRVA